MAEATLDILKASLIKNPNSQDIDPATVARIAGSIDAQDLSGAWFGPLDPLTPVAPAATAGRQWDYPVGFNQRTIPRGEERISFADMRNLADSYTILRLAIETRKDQMAKMPWLIRKKADIANTSKKKNNGDPKVIKALTDFWLSPDKEHTWDQWLRMINEDMLVIDAPVVYPRMTNGGDLYAAELIDGATITRKLGADGRTPLPPLPAYQQMLKGVPSADYTRDELVYFPRNPRTNRVYGMSPVEQVIFMVNIGLRRDISQMQYYTEGNIPEAFGFLPPEWTPNQISEFQKYWDSILEGNTAERRHMKFLPGGSGARVDQVRDPKLKDEYDEWLARIICFCFSLPPTPFVKMMNRSTSESMQEAALEEGLMPMMQWVASLVNLIIFKYLKISDYEFAWQTGKDIDPKVETDIITEKVKTGRMSINEAREIEGNEPIDGGETYLIYTSSGAVRLEDVIKEPEPIPAPLIAANQIPGADPSQNQSGQKAMKAPKQAPDKNVKTKPKQQALPLENKKAEKVEKRKTRKGFRNLDINRDSALKKIRNLKKAYTKFLKAEAPKMAEQIHKAIGKVVKAEDKDQIQRVLDELDFRGWAVLEEMTEPELQAIYKEAAEHALGNIAFLDGVEVDVMTDMINAAAVDFAKERAAEMVGMKWVDGDLVANEAIIPGTVNETWAITESTRDMLRTTVSDAIENGWSVQDLNDAISKTGIFSEDRAEMIARTEIKNADNQGNLNTYKASGLELEKAWLISGDHDLDDECDENESEGWIDIDEQFPSGDDAPGAHPRCTCSLTVRTKDTEEEA